MADVISANADPEANVIFGASIDDRDDGQVIVTLIATGLVGPRGTGTRSVAPSSLPRPARHPTERVAPASEAPVEPEEQLEPAEPPKVTAKPHPAGAATAADDDLELPTFLRRPGPPSARAG